MSLKHWRENGGDLALLVSVGAFLLYVRTLAPSVATLFDDSLEFQVVIPLLGVPHPPGYPLYTLLGKLWTLLIPLRDPAWRLNALSAVMGAVALYALYRLVYTLVPRHRAVFPAVALLALAPTYWSQATIAEVYALHMAFMAAILYLVTTLTEERLPLLALLVGLSLTHHRLTVLLLPTVAYAMWALRERLPRSPGAWARALALVALPQLLYLYIPLVGARVGSLDGTYRNTWPDFLAWVQARAYRVFLTENPFNVQRQPLDFLTLYVNEMGVVALGLALLGTNRTRWSRPLWNGFLLALVVHVLFVVNYKVMDIAVFFLPVLLLTVPFVAVGLEILWSAGEQFLGWLARRGYVSSRARQTLSHGLALVLMLAPLIYPLARTVERWPELDRSRRWQVYDLGLDMVSQPLPQGSAIVGILGETTLVRYFRDVLGYRPDLVVVPADREAERMAAIAKLLRAGREVHITRPLPPAAEQYALDAVGPLIRVRPPARDDKPTPSHRVEEPFTPAIVLAGYDVVQRQTHAGPALRIVLYWDVQARPTDAYKVSARLLRADGSVASAVDDVPVRNTYPTRAWKPGERVVDAYDIPVPNEPVTRVLIILYRAANGSEVHRYEFPKP